MSDNDIRCPICNLNLQILPQRKREEHCDACLDTTDVYDPPTVEGEITVIAETQLSDSTFSLNPPTQSPPISSVSSFSTSQDTDSIQDIRGVQDIKDVQEIQDTQDIQEIQDITVTEDTKDIEVRDIVPRGNERDVKSFTLSSQAAQKPQTSQKRKLSKEPSMAPIFKKRAGQDGDGAMVTEPAETMKRLSKSRDRPIPFYKTMTFGGKKIAVDAFNYGPIPNVSAYFLSHFHSDHYGGLSKNWAHGPVYCSHATARLATLKLRVNPDILRPLDLHKNYDIDGIDVILFDANHCPGAVVFLFDKHTLHTGDFRATDRLVKELQLATSYLETVYLDTTYLDPNRRFPSQDLVVQVCAEYCAQLQSKPVKQSFFTRSPAKRRILAMVGTYTIGKERLALAIARKLDAKIWAQPWKQKVLEAIGDPALNEPLCSDGTEAQVHLTSMGDLTLAKIDQHWKFLKKHFTHLVAFIPTGWTWPASGTDFNLATLENRKTTTVAYNGLVRICRVPYSEHSSYEDLESFCRSVACEKLIATVHTKRYDILRQWEVRT